MSRDASGTTEPYRLTPSFFESNWLLRDVRLGPLLREYDWRRRVVGVLETTDGSFVYKASRHGEPGSDPHSAFVLEFLEKRGYRHSPHLLPTRTKERSIREGELEVVVMEHVEGQVPERTVESHRKLAGAMAELNLITDYPFPWAITVDAVRPAFESIAAELQEQSDRKDLLDIAGGLPSFGDLPRSLIHGEMNLGNTIIRNDGNLVAVDWDAASTGPRVFDAGGLLINMFVSEDLHLDEQNASAFYGEYLVQTRLTDDEMALFFDAAVFHAIRAIKWANHDARWRRLKWAIDSKASLMAAVKLDVSS